MEGGSLLVEVSTGGHSKSIQHALCHLAYTTDLEEEEEKEKEEEEEEKEEEEENNTGSSFPTA